MFHFPDREGRMVRDCRSGIKPGTIHRLLQRRVDARERDPAAHPSTLRGQP
jgi:hypothetical protein